MTVCVTGCETTPKVRYVDKPTARILSLRLQEVKVGYATLLFDVEIDNPYPASLPLIDLSYSLTSGGGTFITATPIHRAAVPPNRRQIVSLPDEVIYARLLKALNSKPGSTTPYGARLWLKVGIPNSGQVELSLRHEGQLTFPDFSDVSKEDSNKHAIYLWKSSPSKDKEGAYSWRSSFSRWSWDNTSRGFTARGLSKLGLNQLSRTVWPLHANIWYTK